jgi:uncharacterized protein YdhG (YjbR/CyaY superfamily)
MNNSAPCFPSRGAILAVVPEAEECISYGMPAFKLQGKTFRGFAAFKDHLTHSGSVLGTLEDELAGHDRTKSSLHFSIERLFRPRWWPG